MNLSNNELDQLFENVRQEKPVASFNETQRAFLAATIASAGGVLATKGLLKIFTFKQWIIMISVLSAATVGTLLVGMSNAPVKVDKKHIASAEMPKKEISITEVEKEKNEPESVVKEMTPLETITASFEAILVPENGVVFGEKKEPIQVRAYLLDDGSYKFVYTITPETTEEDLKKMQQEAKDSGFELKYSPSFTNDKLVSLSLEITQEKENGTTQNIHVTDIDLTEDKEYRIAWDVDDEGQATTIAIDDSFRSNEIDDLLAQLDLEELTGELGDLERLMETEFALIEEMGEVELAEVERALDEAQILLESADVRESLLELEEIDQEALAEAMEDLEEAREELAGYQKELFHNCNKMHEECEERRRKCKEGYEKIITELLNDDLIKDKDDRIKMQAKKGKLTVNGKEVPKKLRQKYKDLVMEHFEVDIDQKGLHWMFTHDED